MAGAPPSASGTTNCSQVVLQVINSQRVVCPNREELEVETGDHVCPSEGCGKVFRASSQLEMHLTRHHQGEKLTVSGAKSTTSCVYFCPVEGCARSKANYRPFPRLGQLKQHYHTVHGSKDHSCQKCGKKFGLRDVCLRHEAECGSTFSCETCGEKFQTKNAHYKHAVRKKHTLPEGSKPKKKTSVSPMTSTVLKPPTIIVKNVVQLPKLATKPAQTSLTSVPKSVPQKQNTAVQVDLRQRALTEESSSASQTNYSDWSIHHHHNYDDNQLVTSSEKSNVSVGTASISALSKEVQEDDHFPLELSDLATQTEGYYSSHHFNLSDFATQTDSLYTLPADHPTQPPSHFSLSDLATQTSEDDIRAVLSDYVGATSHSQASTVTHYDTTHPSSSSSSIPFSSSPPSQQSQAIHTLSHTTSDLGTQTLSHLFHQDFTHFHPHPQLSHSCSTELHHHHDNRHSYTHHQLSGESAVDFGTQTTLPFSLDCSNVNDFGTQTISDQELSDLVHELSSEGLQQILPPECMDFGTQTLESEFAGIECLDFGVQTTFSLQFGADHHDQGSQTQD